MNAADILMYGQRTLLQTIKDFPPDATSTPGACGYWSVKDIIAHLASYELVLVDILAGCLGAAGTPALDAYLAGGAGFNDREVSRRAAASLAEVLAELEQAHARVRELMSQIDAETLRRPGTQPWYGMEYALDDLLVYQYYGHKREHSAQIAAFRDRVLEEEAAQRS